MANGRGETEKSMILPLYLTGSAESFVKILEFWKRHGVC